jgi:ribosomal protein L37AE/L43A
MNYIKQYHLLIEKADKRNYEIFGISYNDSKKIKKQKMNTANVYVEEHHIIPKCICQDESSENLILLLPEEHFVAHQLLMKIYKEFPELIFACIRMTHSTKYTIRNNKCYSWIRVKFAKNQSVNRKGKKHSEETKQKISEASKRMWQNLEYRQIMSERMMGENNPFYGKTHSPEFIQKVKEYNKLHFSGENNPMFGKTHTKEAREKISSKNEPPVTCPHCGKTGGSRIMKRWHFEKCLQNSNSDNNEQKRKTGKQKQLTCPHCRTTGGASGIKRYHFDHCKYYHNE